MSFMYNVFQFSLLSTVIFFLIAFSPTFVDVDPQPHSPVQLRQLKGALAVNDKLNNVEKRFQGKFSSPESLVIHEGKIYTGTNDGRIIEINGNTYRNVSLPSQECSGPWNQERCGYPLGIRVSSDGFLYFADAFKGLTRVDKKTGKREVLIRAGRVVDGKPLMFLDDLTIDEQNNVIYMTDASWKWNIKSTMFVMMELLPTGRIMQYDMKTKTIRTLTDGLIFANGIQMTHDQRALLVADSTRHRISKYHLEGPKKGQKEVFVDRLPGYPDNIRPSKRGGYWIAIAMFKDPNTLTLIEYSYKLPLIVRKVMLRIMDRVGVAINFVSHHLIGSPSLKKFAYFISSHSYLTALSTPKHGLIIEVDRDGNIINSMHSSNGDMQFISEVLETDDGTIYLGSFLYDFIGVVTPKQKN